MGRGLDYDKMKRNDFERQERRLSGTGKTKVQEAKFATAESGAIKVSFRGDQPVDEAIKAIHKAVKESGYRLISNPVLYFYPVGN